MQVSEARGRHKPAPEHILTRKEFEEYATDLKRGGHTEKGQDCDDQQRPQTLDVQKGFGLRNPPASALCRINKGPNL